MPLNGSIHPLNLDFGPSVAILLLLLEPHLQQLQIFVVVEARISAGGKPPLIDGEEEIVDLGLNSRGGVTRSGEICI